MQKAFEKIVERLEEEIDDVIVKDTYSKGKNAGLRKAKIIVNQVAEEYKQNFTDKSPDKPDSPPDQFGISEQVEVCEWETDKMNRRNYSTF